MKVFEAIQKRRSVRAYKSDPVPEESLKRVLTAAQLSPSARNAQERKLIVVKDAQKRKELAEATNYKTFVGEAPIIIVAVSLNPEYVMSSEIPAYPVDLAIAVDHMTLQAVEEGLGTCWIGGFSQEKVKRVLNIPDKYKVVTLFPLGFPDDSPKTKTRKSLKEIICYESFSE